MILFRHTRIFWCIFCMKKFLKTFYKPILEKKLIFSIFLVTTIVSTTLYNIGPYFYKLFVDEIPLLNYSKLISILIIFIGIRILASLLGMASFTLGDVVVIHSSKSIRAKIFKYVQDLDFAFHASKSTGSLISSFTDTIS